MKDEHVADPMRILSRVHQQAFFDRLAKAGLMPTTEIEADQLLKFAETLSAAATEGQIDTDVPAAQSSPKPDDKANTQGCSDATQEKVEQLAMDPAIYNAVLSLREKI